MCIEQDSTLNTSCVTHKAPIQVYVLKKTNNNRDYKTITHLLNDSKTVLPSLANKTQNVIKSNYYMPELLARKLKKYVLAIPCDTKPQYNNYSFHRIKRQTQYRSKHRKERITSNEIMPNTTIYYQPDLSTTPIFKEVERKWKQASLYPQHSRSKSCGRPNGYTWKAILAHNIY